MISALVAVLQLQQVLRYIKVDACMQNRCQNIPYAEATMIHISLSQIIPNTRLVVEVERLNTLCAALAYPRIDPIRITVELFIM